jgi:hypothetical protein
MHRQEIEIELRQTPNAVLDGGGDVEELHVEEDALAVVLLELVGQRQAAARQHAEADLVERHRVADPPGHLQSRERVGDVEGHDEAVVGTWGGHGRFSGGVRDRAVSRCGGRKSTSGGVACRMRVSWR